MTDATEENVNNEREREAFWGARGIPRFTLRSWDRGVPSTPSARLCSVTLKFKVGAWH